MRQTLFFSATMSDDVFHSASQIMRDPQMIRTGSGVRLPGAIAHHMHQIAASDKTTWLATFCRTGGSTLVFTRTKHGAERLSRRLTRAGVRCAAIHGDRTQGHGAQRSKDSEVDATPRSWPPTSRHVVSTSTASVVVNYDLLDAPRPTFTVSAARAAQTPPVQPHAGRPRRTRGPSNHRAVVYLFSDARTSASKQPTPEPKPERSTVA